jgi:hypothetical protein
LEDRPPRVIEILRKGGASRCFLFTVLLPASVLLITTASEDKTVHESRSTFIPVGEKHWLDNPGKIDLELIEVQTGSHLGEDDIERFDDDDHRA